ncbi:hypothetical protein UCRPC4_g03548 [Phaeomoniella chlamydospora]|uniref:Uncharacterized protein n=1 Tax=Phaeomoniella chlamydospora TaxID=158046 RepID=A0A0G2EFD7_PHACM|nr:hypothetical protein UCRPC4_g03548 [Phaeomoniella chlamydospora]
MKDDTIEKESSTPKAHEPKMDKRRLWKWSTKSKEEKADPQATPVAASSSRIPPVSPIRPASPLRSPDRLSAASHQARPVIAASPVASTMSPRPHSPASSQIFERNVQEEVLPAQASPAIPSHIITENHIPPVLEEASAAITDKKLDPDSVEIVTSSLHQPASLTVTGTSAGEQSMASSVLEEVGSHREADESRSNITSMDSADVRRLSFVSFADVVHAEQAAESGDYGTHPIAASQRSTSPLRSPVSSHGFGTSPPTSVSPTFKPLDSSPGPAINPVSGSGAQSPPLGGELNVETMRQALRKTGSGDLSGVRSGMLGPGALED